MSSWRRRDDVALTAADCLLRSFDAEVRRFNGASHLSQLVLRLGAGFDVDRFRALITAVACSTPILRAPVRRRYRVCRPTYRLGSVGDALFPAITVHDAPLAEHDDALVPEIFSARLNTRLEMARGELLRFDIVRYGTAAERTDLAMTWAHLLLDGSGSELFLRRIDDCFHGPGPVADLRDHDVDPPVLSGLLARLKKARQWRDLMARINAAPPHSLFGPRRRVAQALNYDVLTLSRKETATIAQRAAQFAGYLTPMPYYLAAAIRAHDAVFRARTTDPGHYLVPVPVNLRPKGTGRAVFRTNISLLWFHVAREHVDDFAELVAEIMRQRRDSVREGLIESALAGMDLLRVAPARLHSWRARRGLGGELASFFFAFTNEFLPGMDTFLGAPIMNGFHAPSVMPSPGSSLIMSIRDGRLNITHIYQRGAIADDERLRMREQLLDDLLGRASVSEVLRSSG
jgi:hypothetical protein